MKVICSTLAACALLICANAQNATKTAVRPYPLTNCIVSGEKIGGGGMTPYTFTNNNQQIKLCCKSCLKSFQKDPDKYLKKLETAKK